MLGCSSCKFSDSKSKRYFTVSEIKGVPCTRRAHLLLLYIGRVHGAISGCTVLWEVHPASAQNKSLISDTASMFAAKISNFFLKLDKSAK